MRKWQVLSSGMLFLFPAVNSHSSDGSAGWASVPEGDAAPASSDRDAISGSDG